MTAGAFALQPNHVVINELPDYLRGRESGEVSEVIRQECLERGLNDEQMSLAQNPLAGVGVALALLEPGDLALLLVHSHRDEIIELLQSLAN